MDHLGKWLIAAGLALTLAGVLVCLGGRWLGKLPGDVRIEGNGGTFYFPVVSCIILSVVLSVLANVAMKFFGK
jgi:Protein of unknown function (DUF2905)